MPSFVTAWPVLPRVTVGTAGGAAASAPNEGSTDASAAPAAVAVFKKRRRLPPHVPCETSIGNPSLASNQGSSDRPSPER